MGPANGLMGDSYGTDIPVTQVDEQSLDEEKRKAKYSRTKEFKQLREKVEMRIAYYQQFLPGNIPPENVTEEERGKYWAVANILIQEFRALINEYDAAKEAVDNQK